MTIGVIGAMQMEVDDLKAQMTDTQTEVTAVWSLLRAKSVISMWLRQNVE